jgi:hypothetical protein
MCASVCAWCVFKGGVEGMERGWGWEGLGSEDLSVPTREYVAWSMWVEMMTVAHFTSYKGASRRQV